MSKENKERVSQKTRKDMVKYSVGIDISKDKFDVCLSVIDVVQHIKIVATRSFDNTDAGCKQFYQWQCKKNKIGLPIYFIMEATGVYYEKLAWSLHQHDLYVSVVLPNRAKKYIQYLGFKSKNDKIDAKALAQMGAEQRLEKWKAPKKSVVELRAVTRYRESLQTSKTQFNNQLSSYRSGEFVDEQVEKSLLDILEKLEAEIKLTERLIEEKVNADTDLKKGVSYFTEIKGVSLISSATVLAETNCFEMFSNSRQLTSYCGYDVIENQSGKHIGKTKISKKGNAHIRRIMHMPAFNVVRFGEPKFVKLYERVYDRTKIKMKGYVAVQRELLCLMFALWKKEEKYDREYCIRS